MVKPFGFIRDAIEKHFYTIITSIKYQWIFNLFISELAIHTETRGDVINNNFSVRGFWIRVRLNVVTKQANDCDHFAPNRIS